MFATYINILLVYQNSNMYLLTLTSIWDKVVYIYTEQQDLQIGPLGIVSINQDKLKTICILHPIPRTYQFDDDVVVDIACLMGESPHIGVAVYYWGSAVSNRVKLSGSGCVGNIDDHSQPVHLSHHCLQYISSMYLMPRLRVHRYRWL